MTKEQFKKYNNKETFFKSCNCMLPTKYFSYSYIKKNGTSIRCKYCDWIKRHGRIPTINNYSEDKIKCAIEFLIIEKSIYINVLADKLNLSLHDTIIIVQQLKIGNKHYVIKSKCEYCRKDIENFISVYLKTKRLYCSSECYWKYRSKYYIGAKSSSFNRIITDEQKEKMKKVLIKNCRSSKRFDSKIQLTIN